MKKISLLIMIPVLSTVTLNAQKTFKADAAASSIEWNGKKIGRDHTGTINLKEGWLTVAKNTITGGEFIVDMTTIKDVELKDDGMRAKLEGHLKSDDFFGVEKYPVSKLVITGSTLSSDGTLKVKGNLTIKAATNPVEFTAMSSESGGITIWSAKVTVDRSLFDVRYGSGKFFPNIGDAVISDEFKLDIKIAVK
jgi:polyisoprenoid-binding protein YceI